MSGAEGLSDQEEREFIWRYSAESDCRKSLPTKGRIQQSLREVLAERDALREQVAEAWEEGYEAAISDTEARSAPPGPCGPVDPTQNPYRAAWHPTDGAA